MGNPIYTQLSENYTQQGIHPQKFRCRNQSFCRRFAYQGKMTETKMSLVGSHYGDGYPRIVVISLDPPLGEEGKFTKPRQRTTEYITTITEAENYTVDRPNVHWAMTQIIVKDILCLFGYQATPWAAVVLESYSDRPIENVTPYFAHVNAAKCSMNYKDKRQADSRVHATCSRSYLLQELAILQPDILISQGKSANEIVGSLLDYSAKLSLPEAISVRIGTSTTLWLPMDHPSRQISKIRESWSDYVKAIKKWGK